MAAGDRASRGDRRGRQSRAHARFPPLGKARVELARAGDRRRDRGRPLGGHSRSAHAAARAVRAPPSDCCLRPSPKARLLRRRQPSDPRSSPKSRCGFQPRCSRTGPRERDANVAQEKAAPAAPAAFRLQLGAGPFGSGSRRPSASDPRRTALASGPRPWTRRVRPPDRNPAPWDKPEPSARPRRVTRRRTGSGLRAAEPVAVTAERPVAPQDQRRAPLAAPAALAVLSATAAGRASPILRSVVSPADPLAHRPQPGRPILR